MSDRTNITIRTTPFTKEAYQRTAREKKLTYSEAFTRSTFLLMNEDNKDERILELEQENAALKAQIEAARSVLMDGE